MTTTFVSAVNLALDKSLSLNDKSVCLGLGINDPKRIFSTTSNLLEKFGEKRIIEPPTSENALTGIAFGMCLRGYSVCLVHQRFDFALLSFDQIINTISKWKFMFGKSDNDTSLLIRLIIGRGWGQGPTHSQSYHSFLSSLPGLKILYPFDPESAYYSVLYGMTAGTPTIMLEHRWLHNSSSAFSMSNTYSKYISNLLPLSKGNSFTVFAYGYMVAEALKANEILIAYGISIDLFTAVDLSANNFESIIESAFSTNHLLLIDCYTLPCSIINNISTMILKDIRHKKSLDSFSTLSLEGGHESTSYFQTKTRYNSYVDIVNTICSNLGVHDVTIPKDSKHHDVPGEWFKGPF